MKFYVYEHWRPDLDICFYVGKGKGNRAYSFIKRGRHHAHVLKKLKRLGMCAEVRMVASALNEQDAFLLEIERIAFWRAAGVKLANRTAGGEGCSGLKWSDKSRQNAIIRNKARMADPLAREKIRQSLLGRRLEGSALENYLAAMAARVGISRGPLSEETKAKIAAKATGRKASEATKAKMRGSRIGYVISDETREKLRASAIRVQSQAQKAFCATEAGRLKMLRMSRKAGKDPAVRKMRSENAKALWSDPNYREKVMEARVAARINKSIRKAETID